MDVTIQKNKINVEELIEKTRSEKAGEDSIAICVSSEHRKEAFLACEFVIDMIKEKAPIWKKDILPSGGSKWHN